MNSTEMLNEDDRKLVKRYLTHEKPFGQPDAQILEEQRALELLFEHNNRLYKALNKRPSIVVGRRGSGKTSYLNSVYFEGQYTHVYEVETDKVFMDVIQGIGDASSGPVFAESVAKIWENVLFLGLFGLIRESLEKGSEAKKLINDYLAKVGIRDKKTFDDILWEATEIISGRAKEKPHGMAAEILQFLDNVTFQTTKAALQEELSSRNEKAVILLDSMDDFQLDFDSVSRALQGLLKFTGWSNNPSTPIDIRLCLPAELYHRFQEISSNPNKDFDRKLLLHWTATELAMIAAHRIGLYHWAHTDADFVNFAAGNIRNKAKKILNEVLGENVTSKLGIPEEPISYVLRHTQLLPRHILIILNSIYEQSQLRNGGGNLKFTSDDIQKGIREVEGRLVQEIFSAYSYVHPKAREACSKCFPELHHKFSNGDLHQVFNRYGKAALGTDEYFEFKKVLIEIGAIGRVLSETEKYIQVEFEYTTPHRLVVSSDDMLCIHPLFCEVFSVKVRDMKPVYPYGARLDDTDYRSTYD